MATHPSLRYLLVIVCVLFARVGHGQERLGAEGVRERDPVLSANGNVLFFTRPDHVRNQGTDDQADIWLRQRRPEGSWGRALNPGSPVNSFGGDRPLGCSLDGNRLAVLRTAPVNRIDLMEREGRSWRKVESWPLPPEAGDPEELAFNANGQELIYSYAPTEGGVRDLYLRRAITGGTWEAPRPLEFVNGPGNESKPQLGADGRTLYFRRDGGQWYRQTDRGVAPQVVDLPRRFLQLAVTDEGLVATTDDLGRDERLLSPGLPPAVLCPPGQISSGVLGNPPAAGRATVDVPLSSGRTLPVRPDVLQRYAVVVRAGEVAFPESAIPPVDQSRPAGSLASLREIAREDREESLRDALAARQRELARMDQLRQLDYTNRAVGNYGMGPDTLPPTDTTGAFQGKYARELAELERMKAKFRRQQEQRIRVREQADFVDLEWEDSTTTGMDTAARVDTEDLQARVRSDLYPDQRPSATARRPWENDVRPEPAPTQTTATDDEYARQLRELEALRAQLRQLNGTAPESARPANSGLTGKSPAPASAPTTPRSSAAGVTFIPRTAYPDAAGYDALDLLAERVRRAAEIVEVRVHTSGDLSPREAQLLSEERATAIRDYLARAGVSVANFSVVGYGNHEPEGGERVEVVE
ncbi:OmpA family protein [Lewinella sp. IMCC34183]|uniref:OmpA family protein n=1 Tax=Lewinella sp. IMCC34183 TaxID=2248762 RepID=UPI000E21ED63|nr:OmpA family protein [Lewinella sp. IMCC34183]